MTNTVTSQEYLDMITDKDWRENGSVISKGTTHNHLLKGKGKNTVMKTVVIQNDEA